MDFPKDSAWALRENGEVYQWQISAITEKAKEKSGKRAEVNSRPKKIDNLSNIVQIATGEDHFVAVDKDGKVWVMGDDTYGKNLVGILIKCIILYCMIV